MESWVDEDEPLPKKPTFCEKCERPSVIVLVGASWEGVEYRYICTEPGCLHVREKK